MIITSATGNSCTGCYHGPPNNNNSNNNSNNQLHNIIWSLLCGSAILSGVFLLLPVSSHVLVQQRYQPRGQPNAVTIAFYVLRKARQ